MAVINGMSATLLLPTVSTRDAVTTGMVMVRETVPSVLTVCCCWTATPSTVVDTTGSDEGGLTGSAIVVKAKAGTPPTRPMPAWALPVRSVKAPAGTSR